MTNPPKETRPGAGPDQPPQAEGPATPQPPGETAPHERPAVPPQPPTPRPPAARVPAAPVQIGGSVGGDVAAGDLHKELNAGHDIVGRDVVTNTSTTNVGFSMAAVQSLVLAVGALVAATAACFFVLGTVAAAAVVVAFNRPVNSNNQAAAESFAQHLADLRALPPGQPYEFSFTEEEISSYFHTLLEPNLGGQITGGQVRLLDSGQVAIMGRAGSVGGLRFAATFAWQKNTPGAPLRMTGALLDVIPLGDTALGWVSVPIVVLRPVETTLNSLFGNVVLQDVHPVSGTQQPDLHAWDVTVVGQ